MSDVESGERTAGAILKAAREARGMSLEEAAEQLRLNVAHVVALEQDRSEQLGPAVFARGHLRNYAALVGADAEQVLAAHPQAGNVETESSLIPPATANRRVQQEPRWLKATLTLAVMLLAVAAAATAGWWAWHRLPPDDGAGEAVQLPAPFDQAGLPVLADGEALPAAAAESSTTAPRQLAPAEAAPTGRGQAAGEPAPDGEAPLEEPPAKPAPAVAGLVIAFSGPSWLEVYDRAGATLAYELVNDGDVRRFAGSGPWRLVIGNAGAARVSVGGHEVAIPRQMVVRNTASVTVDAGGNLARAALPSS